MGKIKRFLKSHPRLLKLLFACYNALPFNNKIKRKRHNKVIAKGMLQRCKIIFCGKNNIVEIQDGAILRHCTVTVKGNNNKIVFKSDSYAKFANIVTEDDRNYIELGKKASLAGKIHLACIEGTQIIIGEDCLFSSEIIFRTGDSHAVTDMEGNRINPSEDIVIGNHVWIGNRVIVTKGVQIAENIIVGTGAIVTKSIWETNCAIAGVPAKIVKQNINWKHDR